MRTANGISRGTDRTQNKRYSYRKTSYDPTEGMATSMNICCTDYFLFKCWRKKTQKSDVATAQTKASSIVPASKIGLGDEKHTYIQRYASCASSL